MAKFIARVFVPTYIELEAENEEEAQQKAQEWYKEQIEADRARFARAWS